MAQRVEPADSLDYFPTPPWATRALCDWMVGQGLPLHLWHAWEPACGGGHMARPLGEYFDQVRATDVQDYGYAGQGGLCDFLIDAEWAASPPDWIITNPPFRLGAAFAEAAIARARCGAALLVRTAFLEGKARHADLFSVRRPSHVLQFTERVPMVKGRCLKEATTATAYAWVVWASAAPNLTQFDWIAPCRARLERAGDYDPPVREGVEEGETLFS
jgi:hypothetical protein